MSNSLLTGNKKVKFTDIYNKYYPHIFNIVYSKVHDENDSSDICQEIFLVYLQKFDEVENPRKWLLGAMKNILFQHYRRKHKSDTDIEMMLDDSSLAYVNGFRNTRIIIKDAIDNSGLTDEERLLIEYIALSGYGYTLAGEILGLSRKKALVRYEKSVKKILAYLRSKGINKIEDLL